VLRNEAKWIRESLNSLDPREISPMVNVGSSTEYFRSVLAPVVNEEIFKPLSARGVSVVHTDLKPDLGVDVAGDIFADTTIAKLRALCPRSALCSNMMEHVSDPQRLVSQLTKLIPERGYLLVTVPRSFPYHPDPIDVLYRPSPSDLGKLFVGWDLLKAEVVTNPGFGATMVNDPVRFLKSAACSLIPIPDVGRWLSSCHRWLWLFRPYLVTCAILRRQPKEQVGQR
jgi:hypothetical protein